MTLLYTEVSEEFPADGRCVFFAADRRITPSGRGHPVFRKKLVDVPYLNAALGYFGLAVFSARGREFRIDDHLRAFVRSNSDAATLEAFATKLAVSLNAFVPENLRGSERSGIHLAGVATNGTPEFWFIRNVDEASQPTLGEYRAGSSTYDAMPSRVVSTGKTFVRFPGPGIPTAMATFSR